MNMVSIKVARARGCLDAARVVEAGARRTVSVRRFGRVDAFGDLGKRVPGEWEWVSCGGEERNVRS